MYLDRERGSCAVAPPLFVRADPLAHERRRRFCREAREGDDGLVLALTARAEPCQTIAHWFIERRIARISSKVNPADARWYASVLSEGPMATGDPVKVLRR